MTSAPFTAHQHLLCIKLVALWFANAFKAAHSSQTSRLICVRRLCEMIAGTCQHLSLHCEHVYPVVAEHRSTVHHRTTVPAFKNWRFEGCLSIITGQPESRHNADPKCSESKSQNSAFLLKSLCFIKACGWDVSLISVLSSSSLFVKMFRVFDNGCRPAALPAAHQTMSPLLKIQLLFILLYDACIQIMSKWMR